MKYLSFLLILIISIVGILASCSKKNLENKADKEPVSGNWQFIYAIGGELGYTIIKPSADSIETISFNDDFTYTTYTNKLARTYGKYYFTGQNNTTIHFQPLTVNEYEKNIIIISDSLKLSDEFTPGFVSSYARIR